MKVEFNKRVIIENGLETYLRKGSEVQYEWKSWYLPGRKEPDASLSINQEFPDYDSGVLITQTALFDTTP